MNARIPAIALALAFATPLLAQPPQTLQDEYAVYDLLTPDSASFRTCTRWPVTTPWQDGQEGAGQAGWAGWAGRLISDQSSLSRTSAGTNERRWGDASRSRAMSARSFWRLLPRRVESCTAHIFP